MSNAIAAHEIKPKPTPKCTLEGKAAGFLTIDGKGKQRALGGDVQERGNLGLAFGKHITIYR